MARIHQLVVAASDTTNLEQLAVMLTEAVHLALGEGVVPHTHPCVRFISFQIAFAGDGDFEHKVYYKDVLDYCIQNAENEQPEGKEPNEPTRTTS